MALVLKNVTKVVRSSRKSKAVYSRQLELRHLLFITLNISNNDHGRGLLQTFLFCLIFLCLICVPCGTFIQNDWFEISLVKSLKSCTVHSHFPIAYVKSTKSFQSRQEAIQSKAFEYKSGHSSA